jgi:hypothetical protein
MPGMEGIIRPFVGKEVAPRAFHQPGGKAQPPVRIAVGIVGGNKTFSYSGSSSLSSYMIAVNTEKPSRNFDMTTGQVVK